MSESAILEIDAGNTSVKWRLVLPGCSSVVSRGEARWSGLVDGLSGSLPISYRVVEVLLACVADERRLHELGRVLKSVYPQCRLRVIVSRAKMFGVVMAYSDPSMLGVDRCLAMVAAWRECSAGCLVIDCGSAITADIVDSAGVHLGGYIFPGVTLLKSSLRQGTANVPVSDALSCDLGPGCETKVCVDNAVNLMVRSSLLAVIERAKNIGIERCYLTGGSSPWVLQLVGDIFTYRPDLVLDGLRLVAGEGE